MGRRSGGLGSWVGIGKMSLTLLAVAAMMALLASCGDTVYEAKGGAGGAAGGAATGTINISVKDGAGQTSFTKKADSVTVTLLNDPRNQGFPTSVLVDNGGVTFNGLSAGVYQVRVSKPGYASSFSGKLELKNEQDYNDKNQDYFILRTISETVDLFPLSAGLKGTLKYSKPGSTADVGAAAGATVQIVIDDEKLADNREQQVTTGPDGSFTFSELPATNNSDYTIVALSKEFGGVVFGDAVVANGGVKLRPNVTQTIPEPNPTYNVYVSPLVISTSSVSVTGDDEIEVIFSEELDVENLGGNNVSYVRVGTTEAPVLLPVWSGNKVTITPKVAWNEVGSGNVTVGLANVRSKSGKVLGVGTASIAVLDGSFGPFTILKNKGSVNDAGVVILADSTSPIVLVFSKDLDENRIDGDKFPLLNQSHNTKIEKDSLILSPLGDGWRKVGTSSVAFKSGTGEGLSIIFSIDAESFTGSAPTIATIGKVVNPFGLTSAQDTTLGVTDSVGSINLVFTSAIDVEKTLNSKFVAVYSVVGDRTVADVKSAVSSGYGVRTTITSDKISVAPTVSWDDAGVSGDNFNALYIDTVFAENGQFASDQVVFVSRLAAGTFAFLTPVKTGGTLYTDSDSGEVELWFDRPLGDVVVPYVTVSTNEPFRITKTHGDSAISIRPLPGYLWSIANSSSGLLFTLDEDLAAKDGNKLGSDKSITVKIGGGASAGALLTGKEQVPWFIADETLTTGGVVPTTEKIRLAWGRVPNATGYSLFYYTDLGTAPVEVPLPQNFGQANSGVYFEGDGTATTSRITDTIAIDVLIPDPLNNVEVKGLNYQFFITPVATTDGTRGDTTSLNVKTRPKLVTATSTVGSDISASGNEGSYALLGSASGELIKIRENIYTNGDGRTARIGFVATEPLDISTLRYTFSYDRTTGLSTSQRSAINKALDVSVSASSTVTNGYTLRIGVTEQDPAPATNFWGGTDDATSDLAGETIYITVTGAGRSGGALFYTSADIAPEDRITGDSWTFEIVLP